jgi:DNA repair exonuclease SbcCD ATPase subunit
MRLKELVLENFQGIPALTITQNGDSFSVYGTNGTGKTTIGNSISWLLFDKPIDNVKNYNPKTKDAAGNDVHNLHHSAEGTFILEDGSMVTLKKDFYEVYKKKRGSAAEEFSGHTVDFYIDGVPVKQKEYQSRLDSMFTAEQAKVLTSPEYFSEQLNWKDRRKMLLEVCGDISDDVVITSTNELAQLPEYLLKPGSDSARYTVEEFMAIANSKRSELNKKMQDIPTRIDEAQKAKPELPFATESGIETELATLRSKLDEKQAIASSMTAGEAASQLRIELNNVKAAMAEDEAKYRAECRDMNAAAEQIIADLQKEKVNISLSERKLAAELEEKQNKLKKIEKLRSEMLEEYKAEKTKSWSGNTVCPTCGQDLPEEKVQAAIEEFNLAKSKRLEAINQRGKTECSKDMIADLSQQIEMLIKDSADLSIAKEVIESKIAEAEKSLVQPAPYQTTERYRSYVAQIAEIEKKMLDGTKALENEKQALNGEISLLRNRIADWENQKSRYAMVKMQDERISQLEAEEKNMAAAYENLQHGIYLCELFIKRKVSMLDERINSRFKNVRFKLFNELINGGVEECCTVLCQTNAGLKPWESANYGSRVNAGLEIIDRLSEYWGVSVPVVIDFSESIVAPYRTANQMVRLVVSEKDKTLRIEKDNVAAARAV